MYDELGPPLPGRPTGGAAGEPSGDEAAPVMEEYLPMGGKAARMLGLTEGEHYTKQCVENILNAYGTRLHHYYPFHRRTLHF